MKRIVFIISHVGSDSDKLVKILNDNPRIQISETNYSYSHPTDLDYLIVNVNHKLNSSAAIYGDHLLYNMHFSCDALHSICNFIYVIREAKASLNEDSVHLRRTMEAYYRFRLRRIYEMATKTPGAVLLTWENLRSGDGLPLIEKYLNLKEPLRNNDFIRSTKDRLPFSTEYVQGAYEKYLYKLKGLDLLMVR